MAEVADKAAKATKPAEAHGAAEAKPEVAKKRAVVLDPQRKQGAEYVRNDWVVNAEQGTEVDDVLAPGYWSHVAGSLSAYDRIEVRIDTGEYLLELLVKQCGRNWAQVALLHHHDLIGEVKTGEAVDSDFEAVWKGPHLKWCVLRKSDDQLLEQKLGTRGAADAWIISYERTILDR